MRRTQLISLFALPLALGLAACSSDENTDAGPDAGVDAGVPDTGIPPDSGVEVPDSGPLPCLFDQGGEENRGCDPGEVCNLEMDPPTCVPGTACTADTDCDPCSSLTNPIECGHGFNVTAFCDPNHGNVCTRSRAPCEPCEDSAQCGRQDPLIGGAANTCVDYGNGEKFCGRPCTLECPQGFMCDGNNVCVRSAGCDDEPVFCPAGDCVSNPTGQICRDEVCPDTGGAKCSNNDLPGNIGVCIGFCTTDADCPETKPVCNQRNGLCIAGCTKDSCPAGQVCHIDGFCGSPCDNDEQCTENAAYGPNTYCNLPGRPPPRYYKIGYRDANSCAPLGCEDPTDCAQEGIVCDRALTIPECVEGCFTTDDCASGNLCKRGDATQSYTREQCRALESLPEDNETEIGACCYPGCLDRVLQCGIGDFCCGEPDSPYEDPSSCLTLTSTGSIQAEPGLCFEHAPSPFCVTCGGENDPPCNSGWMPGFNVDPDGVINGGMPFQEQEWCQNVTIGMSQVPMCSVTCNPTAEDTGCPGRWPCSPLRYSCLQDADCGPGLECINEDTMSDPPRPGQCKCGENGTADIACPADAGSGGFPEAIENPRCVPFGEDMVCIAGYACSQPSDETGYGAACFQ